MPIIMFGNTDTVLTEEAAVKEATGLIVGFIDALKAGKVTAWTALGFILNLLLGMMKWPIVHKWLNKPGLKKKKPWIAAGLSTAAGFVFGYQQTGELWPAIELAFGGLSGGGVAVLLREVPRGSETLSMILDVVKVAVGSKGPKA
jgi:hypothetical protein